MTTVIDVSNLGDQGFQIEGAAKKDDAGSSVRSGDFNGDGLTDLIVCALDADNGERGDQGAVYVIYGTGRGFDAIDLNDFTPALGDVFHGEQSRDYLGHAASAGDVNGDGIDDLILGARGKRSRRQGRGCGLHHLRQGRRRGSAGPRQSDT